jgi:hypothetical protein
MTGARSLSAVASTVVIISADQTQNDGTAYPPSEAAVRSSDIGTNCIDYSSLWSVAFFDSR